MTVLYYEEVEPGKFLYHAGNDGSPRTFCGLHAKDLTRAVVSRDDELLILRSKSMCRRCRGSTGNQLYPPVV